MTRPWSLLSDLWRMRSEPSQRTSSLSSPHSPRTSVRVRPPYAVCQPPLPTQAKSSIIQEISVKKTFSKIKTKNHEIIPFTFLPSQSLLLGPISVGPGSDAIASSSSAPSFAHPLEVEIRLFLDNGMHNMALKGRYIDDTSGRKVCFLVSVNP